MSERTPTPILDDAKSDRRTMLWIAVFLIAFLIVDILSSFTEYSRAEVKNAPHETIIYETTSVLVLLALLPAVAWVTARAQPGVHDWRRVLAAHAAASLVFSLVHIFAMVALRKLFLGVFYDAKYIFTDNPLREFVYEYRKDVLTYALFVFFLTFGRQLAQQARELAAAREEAKSSKRLTLKCGGRSIFVDAGEVRWAKSASNYVEVAAGDKVHLARATLASIENQLADAGASAIRVHRSYVVNSDYIASVTPTGEGDVKIETTLGEEIPGSRRYRDRLPAIT